MLPKILKSSAFQKLQKNYPSAPTLKADVFDNRDEVKVTGTSKGKGWAGTIKRHNFHRGRKTHGGRSYRRVGSIGSYVPSAYL